MPPGSCPQPQHLFVPAHHESRHDTEPPVFDKASFDNPVLGSDGSSTLCLTSVILAISFKQ